MILTTDILRTWFRQFNTDYFGGELPMPRIVLSKARTRLGTMACKCTRRLLKRVYSDFVIRISTYYECTEREFQETLLHEMIHYYIIYKCIPGLGICFSLRRYAATSAAHYTATRLHAYGATRRAQPNGGRAAHGRPRAILPFLREVPSGHPKDVCISRPLFEIGRRG